MLAKNLKMKELKNQLERRFLYDQDDDSIHLLLNFYDLENIRKIFPKYMSLKNLRKDIVRILRYREGSHLIAQSLSYQIHEDINRLELYLYLEGYKYGYNYKKYVNQLECLALSQYSPFEISQLEYLYHFETETESVSKLRKAMAMSVRRDLKRNEKLSMTILRYGQIVLKPKVYSINSYVDRQLMFNYKSDDEKLIDAASNLTNDEIKEIYKKLMKFLIRNAYSVYEYACWNGINDRVLRRY